MLPWPIGLWWVPLPLSPFAAVYISDIILNLSQECVIENCGEIPPGGDFGICEQDNTEDVFPPFPDDSDLDFSNVSG